MRALLSRVRKLENLNKPDGFLVYKTEKETLKEAIQRYNKEHNVNYVKDDFAYIICIDFDFGEEKKPDQTETFKRNLEQYNKENNTSFLMEDFSEEQIQNPDIKIQDLI